MGVYLPFTTRLPSEYQEVTYIQSDGNCRISTGVTGNNTIRMVTNCEISSTAATDRILFGTTSTGWNRNNILAFSVPNSNIEIGGGSSVRFTPIYDTKTLLDYSLTSVTYAGETKTYSGSTGALEITIFFGNNKGGQWKIYDFKIYNGGSLVRDFVPCYRIADGVIGFYDLVNDVFYTNSRSGTFLKGADIKWSELNKAYIGQYNS